VNPEDTGNLGTIIRSALGFGIKNIVIIKPGVDCFDPKTIRASMGAVFSMNIEYFEFFESYRDAHRNKCYLFMIHGGKELSQVSFAKPFSLVFGSESAGLDHTYKTQGTLVNIKQSKEVDSLNLSIAVGIALYEASI
jgi:TrmH family RNA methyltransferase